MVNILIFRTDRIGDLLLTCPAIITIKKYFPNSKVSIVASEKNFHYAKNLHIFENVYLFPKKNIFKKIKFIYKISKLFFDYIYIFDGKERSIIASAFIKSKNKLSLATINKPYYKILNIKFFNDNKNESLNQIFQKFIDFTNIRSKINNYKFLNEKEDNKFSLNIPIKNYIHFHLDEKWIDDLYIENYTSINPSYNQLTSFFNTLAIKNNLLITTGIVDFDLLNLLINNFFKKINEKIFMKKCDKNNIYLVFKPTFNDIESILRNTQTLISCHGAITHAANSFNVKSIDIIEKGRSDFYNRFTEYLSNYYPIYRSNFDILSKDLINIVSK